MNENAADLDSTARQSLSEGTPPITPVEGEVTAYRTSHDMTTDGLSVTITQVLAELDDVPVTEVVADFSEYADPDALDRIFRTPVTRPDARNDGHVVLCIRGYRVTVHGDGHVLVVDADS